MVQPLCEQSPMQKGMSLTWCNAICTRREGDEPAMVPCHLLKAGKQERKGSAEPLQYQTVDPHDHRNASGPRPWGPRSPFGMGQERTGQSRGWQGGSPTLMLRGISRGGLRPCTRSGGEATHTR